MIAVEWPNITRFGLGQLIGRVVAGTPRVGLGSVLTLRNFVLLAMIPLALLLYAMLYLPGLCLRYRLTNRGVRLERGVIPKPEKTLTFDEFDTVRIDVQPGQEWSLSGDLVFEHNSQELLRMPGIARPDGFRRTILEAQSATQLVRKVTGH